MSVNSVGNAGALNNNPQVQILPRTPEAAELTKTGPDRDRDGDDGGVKAAGSAAPASTVNSLGQKIGQHLSVKA